MSPVEVIQSILKVNQPVAKLVLAGLAVLAAAAIVIGWGAQKFDVLAMGGIILGMAFIATMLTIIVSHRTMRVVIGWVMTGLFSCFMIGLVVSASGVTDALPTPACYIRMFLVPPDVCEATLFPPIPLEDFTPTQSSALTGTVFAVAALAGPEKLWLAQADGASTPEKFQGTVSLQFSPKLPVTDMKSLMDSLVELGWPVQGGDTGAVPSARTPDQNEIRYFSSADAENALRLARALQEQRPQATVYIRDLSQAGYLMPKGQLEVWVTE